MRVNRVMSSEYAEINGGGLFTDCAQHLIRKTLGKPGLGKNQAYDKTAKYKEDRWVHEIVKRFFGRPDHEQGLGYAYHKAGHTDRDDFKHPPYSGKHKDGYGALPLNG